MAEAEIIARRRKWSAEQKAALLSEVEAEGGRVATVARRHGLSESLLYNWRSAWQVDRRPELRMRCSLCRLVSLMDWVRGQRCWRPRTISLMSASRRRGVLITSRSSFRTVFGSGWPER